MAGHDTHLALAGDGTGAVTADHAGLALAHESVVDADLVTLGDTLGDTDNETNLVLDSLDDGVGGTCGGNIDDSCVGLGDVNSLTDGTENRKAKVLLAGFLRGQNVPT